jgi:hypothetical protein
LPDKVVCALTLGRFPDLLELLGTVDLRAGLAFFYSKEVPMSCYVYKIEFGPLICRKQSKDRSFLLIVAPDSEAAIREFHRRKPDEAIHQVKEEYPGAIDGAKEIDAVAPESMVALAATPKVKHDDDDDDENESF